MTAVARACRQSSRTMHQPVVQRSLLQPQTAGPALGRGQAFWTASATAAGPAGAAPHAQHSRLRCRDQGCRVMCWSNSLQAQEQLRRSQGAGPLVTATKWLAMANHSTLKSARRSTTAQQVLTMDSLTNKELAKRLECSDRRL